MNISTSRALIFRCDQKVFLVKHNYINPKNFGKWSTVGGRRDKLDVSDLDCLKREIKEEFGEELLNDLTDFEKAGEFTVRSDFHELEIVTHHFFYCHLKGGKTISPGIHQNEIIEGRFFDRQEVQEIMQSNNFVLGCEANLIETFYLQLQ